MTTLNRHELESAVAIAKAGGTPEHPYDQSELGAPECGAACCVVGLALAMRGEPGPWKWPEGGDPWAQTALKVLAAKTPRALDMLAAIRDDGTIDAKRAEKLICDMDTNDAADILAHLGDDVSAIVKRMDVGVAASILDRMDGDDVAGILSHIEPFRAADLLEEMMATKAAAAIGALPAKAAAAILAKADAYVAARTLALSSGKVAAIVKHLAADDVVDILRHLAEYHSTKAADVISTMPIDAAADVLRRIRAESAAEILGNVRNSLELIEVIAAQHVARGATILWHMEPSDAAALASCLPRATAVQLLQQLDEDTQNDILGAMSYDDADAIRASM